MLPPLTRLFAGLRALVARKRADRELADELQHYLDAAVERRVAEGMSRDAATRAARVELGSHAAIRDNVRDVGWESRVVSVAQDVRYAFRSMRKAPGVAAVVILTFALGIGLTTAIFSVVHAVLLKPLPLPDSDRLVRIESRFSPRPSVAGGPHVITSLSAAEVLDLRRTAGTLSAIGLYVNDFATFTGPDGMAMRLEGYRLEPDVLAALGAVPLLGRTFNRSDAAPGGPSVVLISEEIWRGRFGADRAIVGADVRIGRATATVIGVMAASFEFPYEFGSRDYWRPLTVEMGRDDDLRLSAVARVSSGASISRATAEVSTILTARRADAGPVALTRVRDEIAQPMRPALRMLTVAVVFVLLIACVNVANILLARGSVREREMAVRAALGARRSRLIRQLFTETLTLALVGAGVGLGIAWAAVRVLRTLGGTLTRVDVGRLTAFPRLSEIAIDLPVLFFALTAAVITAIGCSLAPALLQTRRAARLDVRTRTGTGEGGGRLGSLLVVAEIALALALLIGAGLFVQSFARLATVPLGYDPTRVLTFQVALPEDRTVGPAAEEVTTNNRNAALTGVHRDDVAGFAEGLVARLEGAPGIEAAAYAPLVPLVTLLQESASFRRTPNAPRSDPSAREDLRGVSRHYFATMGIRVARGRGFADDDRAGQPRVLVINQALARRDFPGEDPIGQFAYLVGKPEPWQIVGIVDDVRQTELGREPVPQVFIDGRQWPGGMPPGFRLLQYYAIRTTGEPLDALPAVRSVLQQIEPRAALYHVAPMTHLVSNAVSRPRLYAAIVALLGTVAAALAVVGLFGLTAFVVTRRTAEIGVRIALGATSASVLRLVLTRALWLISAGVIAGLATAIALTQSIRGLLYDITPLDVRTFVAMAVIFAVVAALASYIPARRATRVDPLTALRAE